MGHTKPSHVWLRVLAGGIVTVVCFFILTDHLNFEDYRNLFDYFSPIYALFAVLSLLFGYAFRVLRWSIMLTASGSPISWRKCMCPFLGSVALNNVLPLRLGDVVRALIFPNGMGIERSKSITTLVLEKLIDLLMLFVCLVICMYMIDDVRGPSLLVGVARVFLLIAAFFLIFIFIFSNQLSDLLSKILGRHLKNKLPKFRKNILFIISFLQNLSKMKSLKTLLVILLLSVILWIAEAGLFYFLILGFGLKFSFLKALLIMAVATLSTLVPATPGYFGSFHLAAFTAVVMVGGDNHIAGSYAFLAHFLLWFPLTLLGLVGLVLSPELFKIGHLKNNYLR